MMLKQLTLGGLLAMIMLLPSLAFAELVVFDCKYSTYSTEEKAGNKDGMAFKYLFNTSDGSASMLGVNGANPVSVVMGPNSEAINFIEVTAAGNIMTTVIVIETGKSVHSRNGYFPFPGVGDLVPSQYYGKCIIL